MKNRNSNQVSIYSPDEKKQGRLLIEGRERKLIRADDLVREHSLNKTDITKQRTRYLSN